MDEDVKKIKEERLQERREEDRKEGRDGERDEEATTGCSLIQESPHI